MRFTDKLFSLAILLFLRNDGVECQTITRILRKGETPKDDAYGNDSRIVGGHDAEKGRYPSLVALFDSNGFYKCGGTLILQNVVLSAAHCANHVHRIEVGRHDLSKSTFQEEAHSYDIVSKELSPKYGKNSLYENDMDFALFKLSGNGVEHAQTATLNGDSNFPGSQDVAMTVAGWGTTSEGGSVSNILQEVEVFTMSNEKCESKYNAYQGALTDDMMCANVDGGGKDACQGDSGGPGYHLSPDKDPTKDLVLGVVSWGVGCGRGEYPGVYGRVAHPEVLQWISETACSLSGKTPCKLKVHQPPTGESEESAYNTTISDETQQLHQENEISKKSIPDGGCYVKDGKLETGTCALSGEACHQCTGAWLTSFPSCFIEQYGYNSKISWCKAQAKNCKQCGGVFFESPPTLMSHLRRRL